jgi:RloB-like protein
MNTDSLIEAAIESERKALKNKQPYSQVWCVFDRDDFPLRNYMRAFELARANNIETAWTNEAFEFWYLLHFDYFDSAISRNQYSKKLSERGLEYDKSDRGVYEKVKASQETAIRNAKRLERHWNDSGSKFPERENPSTNVHTLVEFLNELAELGKVD